MVGACALVLGGIGGTFNPYRFDALGAVRRWLGSPLGAGQFTGTLVTSLVRQVVTAISSVAVSTTARRAGTGCRQAAVTRRALMAVTVRSRPDGQRSRRRESVRAVDRLSTPIE